MNYVSIESKKVVYRDLFITCCVFLICPLFSLPFILNAIYRRQKLAFTLLALFMGLCAMILIPPRGDLYRLAESFYEIRDMSWINYKDSVQENVKMDFLMSLMMYVYAHLGLHFGWIRFTLVVISYLIFFDIFRYVSRDISDEDSCFYFKLFGLVCLLVPFWWLAVGMRFMFAVVIVLWVYYKVYLRESKSMWVYLILPFAFYFHFAVLPIIGLLIIGKIIPLWSRKSIYIILSLIIFLFSGIFLNQIVSWLPINISLKEYLMNYTSGIFASADYLEGMTFFYWLPDYIANGVIFVVIYYLCFKLPINKATRCMYIFLLFIALVSFSFSMITRYCAAYLLFGALTIICYCKKINFLLCALLFLFLINLYANRRDYLINQWEYLFTPVPCAVTVDYDSQWMMKNVDEEGAPYAFYK